MWHSLPKISIAWRPLVVLLPYNQTLKILQVISSARGLVLGGIRREKIILLNTGRPLSLKMRIAMPTLTEPLGSASLQVFGSATLK